MAEALSKAHRYRGARRQRSGCGRQLLGRNGRSSQLRTAPHLCSALGRLAAAVAERVWKEATVRDS